MSLNKNLFLSLAASVFAVLVFIAMPSAEAHACGTHDVVVVKEGASIVQKGDTLTYKINLKETDTRNYRHARKLVLKDTFPAGLEYQSYSITSNVPYPSNNQPTCSLSGNNVVRCDLPYLGYNHHSSIPTHVRGLDTAVVALNFKVPTHFECKPITNTVTVTTAEILNRSHSENNEYDRNKANNTSRVTTNIVGCATPTPTPSITPTPTPTIPPVTPSPKPPKKVTVSCSDGQSHVVLEDGSVVICNINNNNVTNNNNNISNNNNSSDNDVNVDTGDVKVETGDVKVSTGDQNQSNVINVGASGGSGKQAHVAGSSTSVYHVGGGSTHGYSYGIPVPVTADTGAMGMISVITTVIGGAGVTTFLKKW